MRRSTCALIATTPGTSRTAGGGHGRQPERSQRRPRRDHADLRRLRRARSRASSVSSGSTVASSKASARRRASCRCTSPSTARPTRRQSSTHAPHTTALATVVDELPAIHYMIAGPGGPVRVAPYATFGTDELAASVMHALAGRSAVLLRSHGTLTVGDSLEQAYWRSVLLEWLAALYSGRRCSERRGSSPPARSSSCPSGCGRSGVSSRAAPGSR